MNLPIYQILPIKSADLHEIASLLHEDLNLKRPVVFDLLTLSKDDQREVIGIVENWYYTHQASWRFPYPVYFISVFGESLGHIPVVSELKKLPKFFNQKENKIGVKESQVVDKNRLLQQEVKNADPQQTTEILKDYGIQHKKIWFLVNEGQFYEGLLKKLRAKDKKNG
ncbi:MAG: hypothetical protein K2P81_13870 [Bacteriovoracaceae bacterium]|nr:hypothetical protein [Bacteriovoracaceae bacterium]